MLVVIEEERQIQRKKSQKFADELALKDKLLDMYNELPFHNGHTNFESFVLEVIGRELDL